VDPGDPATDQNLPDPYEVDVLYIDQISDEASDEGTAIVKVLDWQSNCAGADMECPALFNGAVTMTEAWNSGDGTYLYYAQLTNNTGAAPGMYRSLVEAIDDLGSGKDLVNPGITVDYTNYQVHNVTVYNSLMNTRPTAVAVADNLYITPGTSITFDATGSTDPEDGTVEGFLWDLDGDGEFDDAVEGETDFTYNDIGTYAVNVKVTDSGGLSDVLDMPLIVHVCRGGCIENRPGDR
jgi:PKD repeat protein